jgi:hypothetical protein
VRPLAASEDEQDPAALGQAEGAPRLGAVYQLRASRHGASREDVLWRLLPTDRERQEDAARERCREPVRETEVRVRLGQRRRDTARPRREHHRAGDVAAAAEDDVRLAPCQDPAARERRARRLPERAHEREAESPREAGHLERVEIEAGCRDEPCLEPARRPRKTDLDAARAQRLSDREGGDDVSRCSPGRDQAPELAAFPHGRRC